MEPVRLAVIGVGLIGRRHVERIDSLEACSLVEICDADTSRKSIAEEFGVPFYQDVDALLRHEKPEGAIMAVPNGLHATVAETCAKYSVHMLIEKPTAGTLEQATHIQSVTDDAGVRVLVGHHRRHNPLILKARSLIQGGDIGRLVAVSMMWTLLKSADYFQVDWRCQRPSGGPTLINLIHELDILRFLCGEICQVFAQSSSAARGLDVEDTVSVTLSFENGALGSIIASDATPAPWSYELTARENPDYHPVKENCYHFLGTEGSLDFPQLNLWRYADEDRSGWRHPLEQVDHRVESSDPITSQMEHFCRMVRGEESSMVDASDATRSLAVALAVLESCERHVPIDLPLSVVPMEHLHEAQRRSARRIRRTRLPVSARVVGQQ